MYVRQGLVVAAAPHQHVAQRDMATRQALIQLDRAPPPAFAFVQRRARIGYPGVDVVGHRGERQADMRRAEVRVEFDGPAVQGASLGDRLARAAAQKLARAEPAFVGFEVLGFAAAQVLLLDFAELDRQRFDDLLYHLVLGGEDVGKLTVEPVGPQIAAAPGIDELGGDAHAVAGPADAALQDETHAEFAADLLHLDRPPLVGERGVTGDHEQRRDLRQVGY